MTTATTWTSNCVEEPSVVDEDTETDANPHRVGQAFSYDYCSSGSPDGGLLGRAVQLHDRRCGGALTAMSSTLRPLEYRTRELRLLLLCPNIRSVLIGVQVVVGLCALVTDSNAQNEAFGRFDRPVRVEFGRDGRTMTLLEDVVYVDPAGIPGRLERVTRLTVHQYHVRFGP